MGKTENHQYLSFFLADEEYAVGILRVREIVEYATLTRVPSMPPAVRGVMNLRGTVIPVIDLAVKFGMPARPVTKWTCVVILEVDLDGEQSVLGLLADAVSQVIELAPSDIEPPPAFGTRVRADYLLGMGRAEQKFVLLLDASRVLSTIELLTPAAALDGARDAGASAGAGS